MSTQQGFGQILAEIARSDSKLSERIVTCSPDVTVSTNLGPWVNRRGIFARHEVEDVFQARKLMSVQRWHMGPNGQHIELGSRRTTCSSCSPRWGCRTSCSASA
jgi:pyruvate dehydrogenase E1 component